MFYAVLIEAREMRAVLGYTLSAAVEAVRGDAWGHNPKDCEIRVRYLDGREMSIDAEVLSRPTIPAEEMRQRLIAIAEKSLPDLPHPCPDGMVSAKEAWERWLSEGPAEHDIRTHQAMSAEWLPQEEIEAYEREHLVE